MNRGEVWLADLEPRFGTEPGKTRPVLVVQSQALLDAKHSSSLIVPLTTSVIEDAFPLRITVPRAGRLRTKSSAVMDQMRAIDNRRLVRGPLCVLDPALLSRIDEALKEILDLERS